MKGLLMTAEYITVQSCYKASQLDSPAYAEQIVCSSTESTPSDSQLVAMKKIVGQHF